MEKNINEIFDFVIVGGGVVGLATAYTLIQNHPECTIALLEKENEVAAHQTGNNSGVIHSGIYYKPGSLKATNCIRGYHMLIDFCKAHGIRYELCGKLIVATREDELPQLDMLYKRGLENGLDQIRMVEKDEIPKYEPNLAGLRAIHVPYTGIIDYTDVCLKLAELFEKSGGHVFTNHKAESITNQGSLKLIRTPQRDFKTRVLINCAGLYCDKVAAHTNKNIDTRIIPFRGEYYMLREDRRHLVKNLIYPVPDPNFPFLGVHFTRMIHGGVEAGPNAVFAFKREGYRKSDVDVVELFESLSWPGFRKVAVRYWKTGLGEFYRSFSKRAFTKALQRLVPSVTEEDLVPADAGVRAQACDKYGGLLDDFKIIEEDNAIHVLNAPSPAATSSLSIGVSIAEIAQKHLHTETV